jgi:hypothetical protein
MIAAEAMQRCGRSWAHPVKPEYIASITSASVAQSACCAARYGKRFNAPASMR